MPPGLTERRTIRTWTDPIFGMFPRRRASVGIGNQITRIVVGADAVQRFPRDDWHWCERTQSVVPMATGAAPIITGAVRAVRERSRDHQLAVHMAPSTT